MKKLAPEAVEPMKWKEAVEFLIRLVRITDPAKLRVGDLLNVIDDLRRFLEIEEEGRLAREIERLKQEPKRLTDTIDDVRAVVEAAAEHREVKFPLQGSRQLVFRGDRLGTRGAVLLDGELRDTMIDCAAADLEDAELWQICRCEELECKKLFLAGRKGQRHCSHVCANKNSVRKYQKAHAKDRAKREKRRYWQEKTNPEKPNKEQADEETKRG